MSEQSEDLKALADTGELTLRLKSGEVVTRLASHPALSLMVANGRAPEGIVWGSRFFFLSAEGQYVEGLLYPLLQPRSLPPATPWAGAREGAQLFHLTHEGQYDESAAEAVTGEGARPGVVAFPYSAAGVALVSWFNDQVRRLPNLRLMLGTELARVVELHQDGRLECEVETEALEPERRFVAFDASHLDQLVQKLASLSREA
jgi:hypothetical protein